MVAAIAEAVIGPKPGTLINRRAVSSFCASFAMLRSSLAIASSRLRNCTTSGASASQTSNGTVSSQGLDQLSQFAGVSQPLRSDHADLGQVPTQAVQQLRSLSNQHLARLVTHQHCLVLTRA